MTCTRCDNSGFLNSHLLPPADSFIVPGIKPIVKSGGNLLDSGIQTVMEWIRNQKETDVQICDCCGNGENDWYGIPGEHFQGGDHTGKNGPYAYNGGLPECY